MEEIKVGPGPYKQTGTFKPLKGDGPVIVNGKTYPPGTSVRFLFTRGTSGGINVDHQGDRIVVSPMVEEEG